MQLIAGNSFVIVDCPASQEYLFHYEIISYHTTHGGVIFSVFNIQFIVIKFFVTQPQYLVKSTIRIKLMCPHDFSEYFLNFSHRLEEFIVIIATFFNATAIVHS